MTRPDSSKEENFLNDNLEIFKRFCPTYVDKVQQASCEGYEFCASENGDLNIKVVTGSGEYFVHSQKNPRKEAVHWFTSLERVGDKEVLLIFGAGLGYYYEASKAWLKENEKRMVFFIEPDLSLLKMFFQTSLGKEVMSDPQVAVIAAPQPPHNKAIKLEYLSIIVAYCWDMPYQFTELVVYRKIHPSYWKKLQELLLVFFSHHRDKAQWALSTYVVDQVVNTTENFRQLDEIKLFYGMKNTLRDIPAIICGAGPSLEQDLPVLKRLRRSFVLFGAGSGMNALNRNGVMPDMGVGIDPNISSASRVLTNFAYEVPYCVQMRFNSKAMGLLHGPRLYFRGMDPYGIEEWLEHEMGLGGYEVIKTTNSTTHACLEIATAMGCNPIILLGVDLAYTDALRYAKEMAAHPSNHLQEHREVHSISEKAVILKGKRGKPVLTHSDWFREAKTYSRFSEEHPDLELIDCSSQGLFISHLRSCKLGDAAEELSKAQLDIENLLHACIQECPEAELSAGNIERALMKSQESLKRCEAHLLTLIQELRGMMKNPSLGKDYKTPKFQACWKTLTEEEGYRHFLIHFSHLFDEINHPRTYALKYRPESLDPQASVSRKIELEIDRFLFFLLNIDIYQKNSTSRSPEKQKESVTGYKDNKLVWDGEYSFENQKFKINDKELGIAWDESFTPQRVKTAGQESNLQYASIKNGVPEGQCLYQHPEGKVLGEWYYKEGKMHGPSTFTSKEGAVLARGWFIEGRKQGRNLQYYTNGQLYSLRRYKDGLLEGKQEYYYQTGWPKTYMEYARGTLHGVVKLYFPQEQLKRELHFLHGKLQGKERIWSKEGKLLFESEYLDGRPVGISRSWYPSGRLKQEMRHYDSPDQFDLTEWNEEGEVTEKEVFNPESLSREMMAKEKEARDKIQVIKQKLQKLMNGQENDNPHER